MPEPPAPPLFFLYAEICWDMLSGLSSLSLGWLLNGKQKNAYTLGRGQAYIFDTSSTSGYMGEKYYQEFGPGFFDMSSASGYMGEKYVQEFGPRLLARHVIFGVSCSKCCVSWRVNIYCVNKFRVMSCQNRASQRVHAMSWPPCSPQLRQTQNTTSLDEIIQTINELRAQRTRGKSAFPLEVLLAWAWKW